MPADLMRRAVADPGSQLFEIPGTPRHPDHRHIQAIASSHGLQRRKIFL